MQKNELGRHGARLERPVLAWLLLAACCTHAQAQTELDTVREMLRLDAERALAVERQRGGALVKPATAPATRPPERIVVLAIYGLAGRLKADVLVNGERRSFRQGAALARGAQASAREYQLVGIEDACVHLSKPGVAGLKIACFDDALSEPAVTRVPAAAPVLSGRGSALPPPLLSGTPSPLAPRLP